MLAAHSLAEAYSVLTRLPEPHRIRPEDALAVLEANWADTRLVALSGSEYRSLLRRCRDSGIGGGAVYDALIGACARKGRAASLVTWDTANFERFLEDQPVVKTPRG